MPYCATCRTEYNPGVVACADCGTPLAETLPPEEKWVPVFTGTGLSVQVLVEELAALGILAASTPSGELGDTFDVGIFGTTSLAPYTVAVPQKVYEARRAEIEAAVSRVGTERASTPTNAPEPAAESAAADAAAMAEAEEDYQVLGCPGCLRYFHEPLSNCPGCEAALLPAVECLGEGEAAPETVIIATATEAELRALAARYEAAGFHPRLDTPPGWAIAALSLPWGEMMDRTAEADAVRMS